MNLDDLSPEVALKVRQVRTRMTSICPFFAAIGLIMELVPDRSVATSAADGRKVRFNPDWFEALDFEEAAGWLAQKSFQCAANHPIRMLGRNFNIANMASQYVTNPEILDAGFRLPQGHLFDEKYRGLSFERAYAMLEREAEDASQGGKASDDIQKLLNLLGAATEGVGLMSDEEVSDALKDDDDSGPSVGDIIKNRLDQEGSGSADGQDDASGTDPGRPEDQSDFGNCGSIETPHDDDGNRLNTAELGEQRQMWERAITEGEMVFRRIGDAPGAAVTLGRQLREGQQDWRTIVKRFLREVQAGRYSWMVGDRRFEEHIPSLRTRRIARLVIGSDCSASVMTKRQMQIITDEMNELLQEVRPGVTTVIYWDTKVQRVEDYTHNDYPIRLTFTGHGGTKVSPFFQYIDDNVVMPTCCIVFTDLEINDFPREEPPYPVLWASTKHARAPYGPVVMIDEI